MLDFRKQFQEIIEQSYIPFNIDKTATSDVWSNIYKVVLPNIPKNLFRYRRIDDKGYTIESFKSGTISLCHAGMFPDKYDSYLYIDQDPFEYNSLILYHMMTLLFDWCLHASLVLSISFILLKRKYRHF